MHHLRTVVRSLKRQQGTTTLTVVTLALGIGATSAIFSLIQGVLLTPPPYLDPGGIVLVSSVVTHGDESRNPGAFSADQIEGWREGASSLEAIAPYTWVFDFLVGEDGSTSLGGMSVTPEYFQVTGLEPVVGRVFEESDMAPDAEPVVLVGYHVWRRTFDGDPDIIGRPLRIRRRDTPPTIVGVMPPGVRFLPAPSDSQEPNYDVNASVGYWTPERVDPDDRSNRVLDVVARLREGASLREADAELAVLLSRQAQVEPAYQGQGARVEGLGTRLNADGSRLLVPLMLAAGLVLFISCGNVAALLLVRGLGRHQEYGVRQALGAGRLNLFGLVTSEGLVLALLGGGLGVGLAVLIVQVLREVGSHAIPRLDAVSVGWPVLACALGAAVFAAVLASLVPALRASWLEPVGALKSSGTRTSAGRGERRILRGVATMQVGLTLALLVGAGLLIRTMHGIASVTPGFHTDRVLAMTVTPMLMDDVRPGGGPDGTDDYSWFHQLAIERVEALPGVQAAAFGWGLPLTGNAWGFGVRLEGQPEPAEGEAWMTQPVRSVSPGYLDLLGLAIVEGRDVRRTDKSGEPSVALVNQALAERFFPGRAVLGRKLWLREAGDEVFEIVGVVANARSADLTKPAEPEIYLSLFQAGAFSKHLVVRTQGEPMALAGAVQRALRTVEPAVGIENVETLGQIRGDSQATRRFALQLLVGFAAMAVVLTLGGIYGVLSLTVASRRRELAIRAAVGAARSSLRGLIMREGLKLVGVGVAFGLLGAVLLSRALQSFLFRVTPTDAVSILGAGLALALMTLPAYWLPAARAARVSPADALKEE